MSSRWDRQSYLWKKYSHYYNHDKNKANIITIRWSDRNGEPAPIRTSGVGYKPLGWTPYGMASRGLLKSILWVARRHIFYPFHATGVSQERVLRTYLHFSTIHPVTFLYYLKRKHCKNLHIHDRKHCFSGLFNHALQSFSHSVHYSIHIKSALGWIVWWFGAFTLNSKDKTRHSLVAWNLVISLFEEAFCYDQFSFSWPAETADPVIQVFGPLLFASIFT